MKQIQIGKYYVPFEIERKNVKNLSMRILVDGTVKITAPIRLPVERIEEFVSSKQQWIEKQEALQEKRREHLSRKSLAGPIIQLLGKNYHVQLIQGYKEGFELEGDIMYLTVKAPDRVQSVFERQARVMLEEICTQKRIRLDQIMDDYRLPYPEIIIRKMKGKWGSCTPAKAKIVMNLHLVHTPVKCIEYVLIHEYMHMIVPNHSKRFYELIEHVMPDYKVYRKLLKEE